MQEPDERVDDADGNEPLPPPKRPDSSMAIDLSLVADVLRRGTSRVGLGMTPTRIVWVLAATVVVSGIVVFGYIATASDELGRFAAFGLAKRIILPAMYCAFALALILPSRNHKSRSKRPRPPAWWWLLLIALALSFLQSIAFGLGSGVMEVLQGLALFGGALLIAYAGLLSPDWTPTQKRNLLLVLLAANALALAGQTTGYAPFISILVPSAAAAIYLALRLSRHRLWLLALVAMLCAGLYMATFGKQLSAPMSIAVLAEMGSAATLLLLLAAPFAIRRLLAVGTAVLLACFTAASEYLPMFFGASDYVDVTIAHRGYEASAVADAVFASPWTALFGLGPGGVVDLTSSPDAHTLAGSGRDITAVPSIHLLTSHLLLKLGLLGVVALIAVLLATGRQIWILASRRDTSTFDGALLFYVVCGIASAIPAATNLFANPLPLMFLAILSARTSGRRLLGTPSTDSAQRTEPVLRRVRAAAIFAVVAVGAIGLTVAIDREINLFPVERGQPPPPWVRQPVAVFLGDSYTQGAGASVWTARFTTVVSSAESWSEANLGHGGTGYTATPETGWASKEACGLDHCPPYTEMIDEAVLYGPTIVVISGGRFDLPEATNPAWAEAVEGFFVSLRSTLPAAEIIVTSPIWDDDPVPEDLTTMRTILRRAVAAVGGTYVDLGDPLLGHPELVRDIAPNDAGHAAIAEAFRVGYERALAGSSQP